MMITDLVAPEAIVPALKVNSKKQALQELAARAAELTEQNDRAIFEVLLRREKLGTTAVGYGVAIPHGRSASVAEPRAAFVRLATPIDFGADDRKPVDLVAALIVPEHFTDQHLKLLAELAELFSDAELTAELRAVPDARALRDLLYKAKAAGR